MNRFSLMPWCLLALVFCVGIQAVPEIQLSSDNMLMAQKIRNADKQASKKSKRSIRFNFDDEDIVDIINYLASQKEVNIILPAGANALVGKVTLHIEPLLNLDEAWDILLSILDLADYSLIEKDSLYTIVKNSKAISKEPMPLFIGVAPGQLPDTDERIRYLYYLSNIKVTDAPDSMLLTLLKEILPENAAYKVDPKTNALLIIDKANNIRSVMTIITALDQITFKETFAAIKLHFTSSDIVAALFNEKILKDKGTRYHTEIQKAPSEASFFSKNLRILSEPRTNTIIALGNEQAVAQVREFIQKYIDVELGTGKSILHVYQLQYLDAATLAPTLTAIVQSAIAGGTGQARGTQLQTGPERFFEGVIIKADKPAGSESGGNFGGNNLIIAAKSEDWIIIKQLIEDLDKPRPTVIVEILIADLTLQDQRTLGTSIRNAAELQLPNGVDFQTIHVTPQYVPDANPPTTLASDLLANRLPPPPAPAGATSFAQLASPGSLLISLNDKSTGQTWGIAQIIQLLSHSKILSHPHVITVDNVQAQVRLGETRLLDADATQGTAATTIQKKPVDAWLDVKITPRISAGDLVNLSVVIDIDEFITGVDAKDARITRDITTNANVKNGDILVLGGLVRIENGNTASETPLLAQVPILGWFFKKRSATERKNNLTVFISPTIVMPRLRSGAGQYTRDYMNLAKKYAREGNLFDNLRDPITRFFFAPTNEAQEMVDSFLASDELKQDMEELTEMEIEDPLSAQGIPTSFAANDKAPKTKTQSVVARKDQETTMKKMLADVENPLSRV